ncbi:hypothetical protein SAMN05216490_3857 [Mucilaginibacter mallensis]|uniref:Uncharacterized protein n=1 Tax=Mucilaginibacter mallensis TaxID=652787 RepID=A0A1H2B1Q3_MUCMA|nr:hypothetical protein [Mucilaginibacter mallensis]SDT52114.1 hypothetical protein SAMN05216490_3857 [Mucilaginibacter mallensis]
MKTKKISKIASVFFATMLFVAILALNFNASYDGKLNIGSNQAFADDGTGKVATRQNCSSIYSINVTTSGTYNSGDSQVNSFLSALNAYANGSVSGSYITGTYGANAGLGGGVNSSTLNRTSAGVTKTWTASATLYTAHTLSCATGSGTCTPTACADEQLALLNRFTAQQP